MNEDRWERLLRLLGPIHEQAAGTARRLSRSADEGDDLYQAIFMANAGGAWDNAKKVVEVVLKEKGTPLHDATVVGDTVGDPFKDTSSVAMNPVIKFTTLFGLLAVDLAVSLTRQSGPVLTSVLAAIFLLISMTFVWRSFYAMRITTAK